MWPHHNIPILLAVFLVLVSVDTGNSAHSQETVAGEQVVVQVQIFEASLTKLQRLGFAMEKVTGDPNAKLITDQTNGNAGSFSVINDGSEVQRLLEVLRKEKFVKVLAEPTLATISGRTVVFNAGGELSVPKRQPDGSVAIERQYGTVIKLTPEVQGDKVHLAIHCRLAELDNGHLVRVGQQTVPGVRIREFDTREELTSGQTLVIRGLTQVRMEAYNEGVPWISEIPYLGALFRKVREERNEAGMFVLIRPEIVRPGSGPVAASTSKLGR